MSAVSAACPACGARIDPGATVCHACWQRLVAQLREQGTPTQPPRLIPLGWRVALVGAWLAVGAIWWLLLLAAVGWVTAR